MQPSTVTAGRLESPRIVESDFSAAHALACHEHEPVFVPAAIFADDRGWSIMNLLQGVLGPQGQVNFSCMYPNVVKAWHRHHQQSDFWLCAGGNLKAGIHRETDGRTWLCFLGEKRPGVLIVPPELWHGAATVGPTPAGLFYYVTRAYDRQAPDEDRRPFDSITGFPWTVRHG